MYILNPHSSRFGLIRWCANHPINGLIFFLDFIKAYEVAENPFVTLVANISVPSVLLGAPSNKS